jgi:hypothetical protein
MNESTRLIRAEFAHGLVRLAHEAHTAHQWDIALALSALSDAITDGSITRAISDTIEELTIGQDVRDYVNKN